MLNPTSTVNVLQVFYTDHDIHYESMSPDHFGLWISLGPPSFKDDRSSLPFLDRRLLWSLGWHRLGRKWRTKPDGNLLLLSLTHFRCVLSSPDLVLGRKI